MSAGVGGRVRVAATHTLSTRASNRATAYPQVSNKIVRAHGRLVVSWLDGPSVVQVATYDGASGEWTAPLPLGEGQDNHAGAALTMDGEGFLYAAFGPHHGPFQFRRTLRPFDATAWAPTEWFGADCTHPSLVCAADDTLHLVHRVGRSRWRLHYRRRPRGGAWSEPLELVDPCFGGYTHFWPSLAAGADGSLHLSFAVSTGSPFAGRLVGYLRSTDGGRTWTDAAGDLARLPLTPAGTGVLGVLETGAALQMTPSNLALDSRGRPWLAVYHRERRPQDVTLWHHDGSAWRPRPVSDEVRRAFPGYEHAAVTTITFDAGGRLYLAAVLQREGEDHGAEKDGWGEPGDRVVLLTSDDGGGTIDAIPVSGVDPARPNWLATIERPYGSRPLDGPPGLVYTHGGSGVSNTLDRASAEVVFVQLAAGDAGGRLGRGATR